MIPTQDTVLPTVLVIGGFDGSSGAGVSADLRMVQRLGGYGVAALTALTVQDHHGFDGASPVDGHWIRRQIGWLLDHYPVKAVKIGMLSRAEAVRAVLDSLADCPVPLVVDPVLASSSGAVLLDEEGQELLVQKLLPMACLITPNLIEAGLLCELHDPEPGFEALAHGLSQQFGTAVLLKGGHVAGETTRDLLIEKGGRAHFFSGPRVEGVNSHGTGCRLASSVATALALGYTLKDAVGRAKEAQDELFRHPLHLMDYGPVLG